jgi:hypothetical protein
MKERERPVDLEFIFAAAKMWVATICTPFLSVKGLVLMNSKCWFVFSDLLAFIVCIGATPSTTVAAQDLILDPTSSFTARLIGGHNVLVGAPDGTEGTQWQSTFLDIKEETSDRTVLEFDLRGQSVAQSATLNIELANLDDPDYTTIFVYSFDGNGLANAADYFRIDNLITAFTDFGMASNHTPPYHIPYSFDLTPVYNDAISDGGDFLGIVLKNTTAEPQYARYRLTTFNGLPKLVVYVPETTSLCLASVAGVLLCVRRQTKR